jgi:hypothetical protein
MNLCLPHKTTEEITLQEFIGCDNNVASNRQTRMLAEYIPDGGCDLFRQENKYILLENAKKVLKKLIFFALNEYRELSQELFERTFHNNFKFSNKLDQLGNESATALIKTLNYTTIKKIKDLNDIDLKLYEYAKKLFFKRLNYYRNL